MRLFGRLSKQETSSLPTRASHMKRAGTDIFFFNKCIHDNRHCICVNPGYQNVIESVEMLTAHIRKSVFYEFVEIKGLQNTILLR